MTNKFETARQTPSTGCHGVSGFANWPEDVFRLIIKHSIDERASFLTENYRPAASTLQLQLVNHAYQTEVLRQLYLCRPLVICVQDYRFALARDWTWRYTLERFKELDQDSWYRPSGSYSKAQLDKIPLRRFRQIEVKIIPSMQPLNGTADDENRSKIFRYDKYHIRHPWSYQGMCEGAFEYNKSLLLHGVEVVARKLQQCLPDRIADGSCRLRVSVHDRPMWPTGPYETIHAPIQDLRLASIPQGQRMVGRGALSVWTIKGVRRVLRAFKWVREACPAAYDGPFSLLNAPCFVEMHKEGATQNTELQRYWIKSLRDAWEGRLETTPPPYANVLFGFKRCVRSTDSASRTHDLTIRTPTYLNQCTETEVSDSDAMNSLVGAVLRLVEDVKSCDPRQGDEETDVLKWSDDFTLEHAALQQFAMDLKYEILTSSLPAGLVKATETVRNMQELWECLHKNLQNSHLVDLDDARTFTQRVLDERLPRGFTYRLDIIRTRYAEEAKREQDYEVARSTRIKLRAERRRLTRTYRTAVKEAASSVYDHDRFYNHCSDDLEPWSEDEWDHNSDLDSEPDEDHPSDRYWSGAYKHLVDRPRSRPY